MNNCWIKVLNDSVSVSGSVLCRRNMTGRRKLDILYHSFLNYMHSFQFECYRKKSQLKKYLTMSLVHNFYQQQLVCNNKKKVPVLRKFSLVSMSEGHTSKTIQIHPMWTGYLPTWCIFRILQDSLGDDESRGNFPSYSQVRCRSKH